MKFARIYSAQNYLLKAHLISVEVDISRGLHSFSMVGLPGKAVEEARDRVSAAIKNSGFESPKQTNAKITVSLAPADLKKEGPAFDVPIALGYLLASGEIEFDPKDKLFIGELALDGKIRPVRGVLSYARLARSIGIREIYVPKENVREARLVEGIHVYGARHFIDIVRHLNSWQKPLAKLSITPPFDIQKLISTKQYSIEFDDIVDQDMAKRGLAIAAAGGHNIALFGPPGTGKTMLARAFPGILPPLSFTEMLEVTEIHSIAGTLEHGLVFHPPIRTPHHTASHIAIMGGGSTLKPGEITLAHRGVLFLDEFPEFDTRVIESLRQPLEDRTISVSRARGTAIYPAHFILIAALNPCPCGNKDIEGKICRCTPLDIRRYELKMSGPIMDRIDMWVEVSKVNYEKLGKERSNTNETSVIQRKVIEARETQRRRCEHFRIEPKLNAGIQTKHLAKIVMLSKEAEATLTKGARTYDLSARGYHRTIKLARTIADLEGSEKIEAPHVLEALQYRQKYLKPKN